MTKPVCNLLSPIFSGGFRGAEWARAQGPAQFLLRWGPRAFAKKNFDDKMSYDTVLDLAGHNPLLREMQ